MRSRARFIAPAVALAGLLAFATAIEYGAVRAAPQTHAAPAPDGTAIGHNSTDGDGTAMGVGRT
ncbi:hypothetical protein [Actinomadura rupiterrae]|uniref:hypothetical protein n=1 Tax=Actinomadura rupiterrae TaxID=559627 RepID=UPI0020A4EC4A|nr:hypothetical protein [Actinomadura rupiterrae]MCP2343225.1 hypothetical protein [Actinomadura rupiterrae]